MGSLEDLRDYYKSSTKSKHMDVKSNGSTYSNAYKKEIYKRGNLVHKKTSGTASWNDIDEKYGISSESVSFSLNKKGRWKMASELKQNMGEFAENDEDVRLYETRDRILRRYDDCIGFVGSKGNQTKGRAKYANKDSIKNSLRLDEIRARHPVENNSEEEFEAANNSNRNHKKTKKKNRDAPERIVIDLNDHDDEATGFTEYEIQYPPTMEVLKYNTLFEAKRKDWVTSKLTKNILGDELNSKNLKDFNYLYTDDYLDDIDYEDHVEERKRPAKRSNTISLAELINEYTKPIVEKRRNDMKESKTAENGVNEKELRKMVFISRQNSRIESHQHIQRQISIRQAAESVAEIASIEVIPPIVTQMNAKSLESDMLKQRFGLKYCEAYNAWPRMLCVNLNDAVAEEMGLFHKLTTAEHQQYDVRAWLCVKEIPNLNDEACSGEVTGQKEYFLSLKANLHGTSVDLNNIDLSQAFDFDDVYAKVVELVARQPLETFRVKEKAAAKKHVDTPVVDELPTIAAKSVCKEIEDLKFEYLNKDADLAKNEETRSTSSDSELDEVKVQEKLDELFKRKFCSCHLCFEDNLPVQSCTVLLNCAHTVCNTCWKDYIDVLMTDSHSNAGKLNCPVCDVDLELALIINFVSDINRFEQYLTATIDRVITVMFNYKWCQSPGCNRAIKVDFASTPYGVLSCECGYKTCLKCNMAPHFPAKCSQVARYYTELRAKNNFLVSPKAEIYTGIGKKCPKCFVFMEKNGGCNQMVCTLCKETFCWNCVNVWSEHLKLTQGNHSCTISSNQKKQVTVEFKKDSRPIKPTDPENFYANCVYHREQRARKFVRERNENVKRLLNTIKQGELVTESFAKMNLIDQCKLELQKRDEARRFLQKMLSFLNELHFVCEHTYLLIRDTSIKQKSQILKIVRSLEMIIWKIHNIFASGTGKLALSNLEEQMNKGLNCLNAINNLNIIQQV